MKINEIPRGQLPTIILSSLLDGDKYGYEIIDSIEQRTNGEIVVKKPSLYSTLTRLEKQDLVSSYWKDSDIGGRRHYYRLTDFGKKQVLQWEQQLYSSQNKLAQILQKGKTENIQSQNTNLDKGNSAALLQDKTTIEQASLSEISDNNPNNNNNTQTQNKPQSSLENKNIENEKNTKDETVTFLKQENLFDLSSKKDNLSQANESIKEKQTQQQNENGITNHDYLQYNLFSNNAFIAEPEDSPNVFEEERVFETKNNSNEDENQKTLDTQSSINFDNPKTQNQTYIENFEKDKQESHKEKVSLFKQNINKILEKETVEFEERLQKAKKSFNFESEYRRHFKSSKSYADTFDENGKKFETQSSVDTFANIKDIKKSNSEAKSFTEHQEYQNLENTPTPNQDNASENSLNKLYNQFEEKKHSIDNQGFNNKGFEVNKDKDSDLLTSKNNKTFNNASYLESFEEGDNLNVNENLITEKHNLNNFNIQNNEVIDKDNGKDNFNKQQSSYLKNDKSKIDDEEKLATVITDRIESGPKVQKIMPASFSHLNKNSLPEKKQTHTTTQNYEEEVFLEKIVNNEEIESNVNENVTSNIEAQKYFLSLGIKMSEYAKPLPFIKENKTFKTSGKNNQINIKKHSFIMSLMYILLFALQVGALLIYLNINSISYISEIWFIVSVGFALAVWCVYNLIRYLKDKNNQVLKDKILLVPFWQKVVLSIIFLVLVFSIHLIAGLEQQNYMEYLPTLVLPAIICFNFLLLHPIQKITLK